MRHKKSVWPTHSNIVKASSSRAQGEKFLWDYSCASNLAWYACLNSPTLRVLTVLTAFEEKNKQSNKQKTDKPCWHQNTLGHKKTSVQRLGVLFSRSFSSLARNSWKLFFWTVVAGSKCLNGALWSAKSNQSESGQDIAFLNKGKNRHSFPCAPFEASFSWANSLKSWTCLLKLQINMESTVQSNLNI